MKNINFINSIAPQRQREVLIWYRISAIIFVLLVSIILYIQIKQLNTLIRINKERQHYAEKVQEFDALLTQKNRLKKEEQDIKQKVEKINQLTTNPKNPYDYLVTLNKALSQEITLAS